MSKQLVRIVAVVTMALGLASPLAAQSLTNGGLRGLVVSREDGGPITGVQVTLEGNDGRAIAYLETDRSGEFSVPLLVPGLYRVLAEAVGLQPVRYVGVTVVAGQTTSLTFRLERRPPPITRVEEVLQPGAPAGTTLGRTVLTPWLRDGDRFRAATDASRNLTEVVAPGDAREGWVLSGGGLNPAGNRMMVDGVPETLLRHPGLPGEPASAPLFQREGLAMLQVLGMGFDTEWRGFPGAVLNAQTAKGGNEVAFRPYATFSSASLAGTDDNPADSAANSFQFGAELSGPIIRDTASFSLRFDYQQLRTPSTYTIADAGLREQLTNTAESAWGVGLNSALAPVVRQWTGFSSGGRLDWRINRHTVLFRFGFARWTEDNPLLLEERSNLAGTGLEANDVSGALSITSAWTSVANELRIGFSSAKRDWLGDELPPTSLAAEGVAFGNSAALPGLFSQQVFDVTEALQISLGRHRFKGGVQFTGTNFEQDYRYGADGVFTFGGLDAFGRGEGTFFQTTGLARETGNPTIQNLGFFLQDTWSVSPEIALLVGVRYDKESMPDDKITYNADWFALSGERNDFTTDNDTWSPRAALVWDVQNRGEWIVRGGAGLYPGRIDPSAYAEASLYDVGTTVVRGQGTFSAWPTLPDATEVEEMGERLTYFNGTYKAPRGYKGGLGISRNFLGGISLHLTGSYQHTDYLLRRADRNLAPAPQGETQEGRPVYGRLVQQDGLVSPEPGSNRRFTGFDQVHVLSPTGFSDYFEFTAMLERRLERGLSYGVSYTFSRTEDNVPGSRSPDPADQLNPFPEGLDGGDWAEGRSDFDVPHRMALSADYATGGKTPISVGARFRYRSGLPFTPGFRPGVDVNGDGAGGNDPAFLDSGLSSALSAAGCGTATNLFAERNSCREDAAYGLDLRVAVGLPIKTGGGGHLAVTLDAFNVVASAVGIVDRALVLVDPNGTTLIDGAGNVTLPFVANPNFGSLLVRRNDLRTVRIGLRMEY
jgi:hypothetical protein